MHPGVFFEGTDLKYNPLQHYCCACAPQRMCVIYRCNDVDQSYASLPLGCTVDEEANYKGQISVDAELVDVEFNFLVEGETCFFTLTSGHFGADGTGDAKIEITPTVRSIICPRCEGSTDEIVFPVATDDCGYDAELAVLPGGLTSLKKHPLCCNEDDPCDGVYETREEAPCVGICGRCKCLCTHATIVEVRDGDATTLSASICNRKYQAGEYTITVQANSSNCCELALDIGANNTLDTLIPVPIGDIDNPCPEPEAEWSYTDSDTDEEVTVYFFCQECGETDTVIVDGCCEDAIPKLLTASVSGGDGCCGDFTVTLFYNSVAGIWEGSHPTAMCNHDVEISLTCGATEWSLGFEGTGCTGSTVTQDSGSTCNPVSLIFTVETGGVGCCDEVGSSGTLTITVTE